MPNKLFWIWIFQIIIVYILYISVTISYHCNHVYIIYWHTTKLGDVMARQVKVWSSCPTSWGVLGQVCKVANLPHKILTILPIPIFVNISGLYVIYVTQISHLRAIAKHSRWSEMSNKNAENYFCAWCLQISHHFHENLVAHLILHTPNYGGVRYNHDFQTPPSDQRMTRYGYVTNLPCCPSCSGLPTLTRTHGQL